MLDQSNDRINFKEEEESSILAADAAEFNLENDLSDAKGPEDSLLT